jgi:hypothetical protein
MLLTNGQRGDVIDALKAAMEFYTGWISSETIDGDPATARGGALDSARVTEMLAQVKRWRALRRHYLAEEKLALKDFANVRKALRGAARQSKRKGGA